MMRCLHILISLLLCQCSKTNAQDDLQSPCPRLFVYEGKSNEPDRWYGIVTLLGENDFSGVWLRVILDREALQLGNWFGSVKTTDNKEFLITNRNFNLKAHTPVPVRFFIKFNPNGPTPKLQAFRLNAKTVCPEGQAQGSTTSAPELQTNGPSGQAGTITQRPAPPVAVPPPTIDNIPGSSFFGVGQGGDGDEDFFKNELYNIYNRTHPATVVDDKTKIEDICGTVVAQPRPLITYGIPANEGEFPWHVALYYTKGIDLSYICGASLISREHVLTVAHCVTRPKSKQTLITDNLVVYLGKYFLKRFTSTGVQDRQVSQIIPHPQYNSHTYSNDIALIKLATPAEFTDYVRPICLWQESIDLNAILNKQGVVVGWGFDENGKLTEHLMRADMPVVTQETCLFSYPEFYSRFTSSNTYCAGFRNGTSVCNGDSGGGMVFSRQNSQRKTVWHIRGLVSISVALQNQFRCDTSHFVVFTDSAKYLDWIKKAMK